MNHIQGIFEGANLGSYYSYKYKGKELQETGMYDYGARFYMPDLGRWGVHDPLSELQFAYSPYSYVYGNPIKFNDPTGMIGECPGGKCPDGVSNIKSLPNGEKETEIQEIVLTGQRSSKSTFAGINFHTIASMLAPIRPATEAEMNRFGTYGQGIGNDFKIMWKSIKAIPSDIYNTFENLSALSESEDKEEFVISTAIVLINLRKGKLNTNLARMGAWPWKKSATIKQLIKASCDLDAKKIQQTIGGGKIITVSNPIEGLRLGPVKVGDGVVTEWFYHKAVQNGDFIYDRVTGPQGMHINDYKKLFEYGDDLKFE